MHPFPSFFYLHPEFSADLLHRTLCSSCSADPCTPKTLLSAPWNASTTSAGAPGKTKPDPLLPLSPASQAGQEGSEGGRGEDQLLSVQCSKCLRASTGMWHQNVCHSLKIRNILSSSAGDRNKVLKVAPTKEHVLSETCGSTAGGGGGSVFDCFCSRNCSWPNSHNPPWPFPPTYPSNTLEQWRIDRRKLQPCLEFTTIPS